ncbi:MAG: TadE/TadG family type IV pilus assembly protein [Solirubrobacteraceae bacterium]
MQTWTSFSQQLLRLRGRLREERGQAIVEFAVVLPVLIMIILGILYFGRYEDYTNQETQLAEMGVRWAAVDNNPGAPGLLKDYIQSQAQPELQAGSSDVTKAKVFIYYPSGSGGLGNPVRVCVVTKVSFPTPVTLIAPTIAQAATMRIEQPATGSPVNWTPDALSTAQAAGCP